MTFTGQYHTYTFDKTIQELITGFPITVLPDTYTITYNSVHTPNDVDNKPNVLSKYCDVLINDIKTISNSSTISLEGKHDDYLMVMDNGASVVYLGDYTNGYKFFEGQNGNTYKYAYYNIEDNQLLTYYKDPNTYTNIIPNATKNNIYHIVSNNNGTTEININPFNYNLVGW